MPLSPRRRAAMAHPDVSELNLLEVLHALSDSTRMSIVQTLLAEPEMRCGEFPVDVAPSTLSHHFRCYARPVSSASALRATGAGRRCAPTISTTASQAYLMRSSTRL
jgi:hypothetical protein